MIFDTHAHYDDEAFDIDRDELLFSLKEKGVSHVVNVGASMETSKKTMEFIETYSFMYGAVGVHPNDAGNMIEEDLKQLQNWSKHDKVVAIGEIGLDYYYDEPAREIQKKWLEAQMELARTEHLPIIIHSRDAAKDTQDMMHALKGGEIGGVIHCFSYGVEVAKDFLNQGFYLGIGGVVTFKNAKKIKEVVEYMPLDRLLLETDCPYLTPVPNRGKRNDSSHLHAVVSEIANIKGVSEEEIEYITMENAKKMYRIK